MKLVVLLGVLVLLLLSIFGFGGTLFVLFIGAIYSLPTIVAGLRSHPNGGSIIVLNLLLGWTLVGWVVSLAMACSGVPET